MKKEILFDLDGTLTDPREGITKSVAHALEYYGIHEENLDRLTPFIGPPLTESFAEFYGFDRRQCETAIEKYREYFRVKGLYENQVYPGITDMLKALNKAGKTLILATSKPEEFSVQIMEHFHLAKYFAVMAGSDMAGTRVRKGVIIQDALSRAGVTEPEQAVMVGDRRHDVVGAREAGIEAIGVLYGYGGREELSEAGADRLVGTVEELTRCLLTM